MNDIAREIEAINRIIGSRRIPAGEGRSVVLRRRYDAPIEDVWDACSDPDRLKRWFSPVSGDLRVGGTFQIEGNAGGEILRCQPPPTPPSWSGRPSTAGSSSSGPAPSTPPTQAGTPSWAAATSGGGGPGR